MINNKLVMLIVFINFISFLQNQGFNTEYIVEFEGSCCMAFRYTHPLWIKGLW